MAVTTNMAATTPEKTVDNYSNGHEAASSNELDRASDFEQDAGGVDAGDMYRMGKEQQFKRIFRVTTMMFFTSMVQSTWEIILITPKQGLINGGLAGLFWSYIWTFIGFCFIVLSLAEMASMAPTSGGQYHWVSEFAPRRYQRFLSYMSGWMSTLSWQAGSAGGSFLIGTLIQGMIIAYQGDNYNPKRWHGTLFVFAIATIEGIVNILLVNWLPWLQTIAIFPHGLGWIAVIAFLAALAPKASAHDVFLKFSNTGGWSPIGLSLMVGQITSVYFMILSDSAAHLAEEVKTASRAVPQAMMWSFGLNAIVGFGVLIAYLFAMPDLDAVIGANQQIIYVFQQASYWGTIPLMIVVFSVMITGSIDANASTSRQTFAFARDGGLPFKRFLARVSKGFNHTPVPRNAILFTCLITCLLSLINIGSDIAFYAIISLQLMALMATYTICIGCVLWQRTVNGGAHLPYARWSLGRFGTPVNAIAFVYSIFIFFWTGWPPYRDPTLKDMNWSSVMFGGVFAISLIYYVAWGRKHYKGPVVLVRNGRGTAGRGGSF